MSSPTQRTLAYYRSLGFEAQVVEKWIPQVRRRVDLAGCIDVLCWRDGVGIIGVQACAGSSHAARRTKSLAEPRLRTWLAAGGRFEIVSWSKRGERGKRKVWTPRREELFTHDLPIESDMEAA